MDLPSDNSRKIVTQELSFEKPDRVPVFDSFWDEFIDGWRSRRNAPPEASIEDYYWIDLQVPVAREELFATQMREIKRDGDDVYVDDGWGRVVRTRPGTFFSEPVERVLERASDLDRIEFDPPDLDSRYTDFLEQVRRHRAAGRAVFIKIGGPFIRSTFFRGEMEFLIDLAADESFARAVVEKVGEHLLQIGLESLKRAEAQDFGVWIYDDMCNVSGPMFSPKTFERVFLPVYKHMVSSLKAAGARWVILHCDGNLLPLLDMVIDAGIDAINPVEHAAGMDLAELAEKYSGRLRFIGGVCNSHILPRAYPKEIRAHVEAILDAAENGGVIVGTHSVGPDIPLEAYELYREIVKSGFDARA